MAGEIARLPKDTVDTIRLSDAMIYRCSRLSFVDRGFAHPFVLIESLTTEVVKAEKKAYEKVIRMIAHEVNNTTAGITSTLETVGEALKEMDDTEDIQEVMKVCVERCYGMSRFITNFANVVKIPEPSLEQVRLNDRVTACRMFMETVCRDRRITFHNELCPENPTVRIDTVLFEQVLVNIIKNAAESIGECGDIYIRTTASPVTLEIADSGKGISREVEAKQGYQPRGGSQAFQPLLLHETERAGHRPDFHPRGTHQARMHLLPPYLFRRSDPLPHFVSARSVPLISSERWFSRKKCDKVPGGMLV